MNPSLIVWNVRGLGDFGKRGRVKRLLARRKASIVGLVETKWNQCSDELIAGVSGSRDSGWAAVNAVCNAGGIAIYWDKNCFRSVSSRVGAYYLQVDFQEECSQKLWSLAVVYGPQDREEKLAFIREIDDLCSGTEIPLCIAGDFNLVRSHEDYRGARRNTTLMDEFNECININGLLEIPLSGSLFTWCRGDGSDSFSRIDRAFINQGFDQLYQNCSMMALERVESDHNPLLIKLGAQDRIRRPWKFENMWLQDERFFRDLETWMRSDVEGFGAAFRWSQRLQNLKGLIKVWNKEVFGNINTRIEMVLSKINELDLAGQARPLSGGEINDINGLKIDLSRLLSLQEILWRQKVKEQWLKLGDDNSRYFHVVANNKRRFNMIECINIQGVRFEGRADVAKGVVDFYTSFFRESVVRRPFPRNLELAKLNESEAASLMQVFSEAEIWTSLRDSDGWKAPGPDGFSWDFYKRCWPLIRGEVLNALSEFHETGTLPKRITHSFLCLVPKRDAVEDIKDLRPISLMGSLNKLISKILARRLSLVLPKLVSSFQQASVRGRQISEAALIGFELLDSRKKSRRPGLIFKLDIERAFDCVSWGCLFRTLAAVGFPRKWCDWIRGTMCSPVISTIINGEAKGFFNTGKGLRQGDPLSPGLFTLIMELLSSMLSKLRDEGKIRGFFMNDLGREGEVTHLLFADDTLIFCEASVDQVLYILSALVCFQAVSGLKINLEKSMMIAVGDVPNPEFFAAVFGCNWTRDAVRYLGYPLGAKVNSATIWEPIIEKMERRLAGWKGRLLSLGGRLVLNSAVLNSQPTYFFSLFKAPRGAIQKMEKIQRRFIWGGTGEDRKMPLVNWDLCKASKDNGGLAIKDLYCVNKALLIKWLWKYATDRGSWWRELISIKYPADSEWQSKRCRSGFGESVWANITKEYDEFWKVCHIDPGSGEWVSFWKDCWIPNHVLADSFPRVAAVATDPDARVSDLANNTGS
ncbi:unnamed protein product [Linum tenue]|uniref:Reverse transcriptase domain-containing protein n=1 Tax=Linum tenue TaxID=586396 RepID=A0AAV0PF12_9ROSI|nr:unnamed protein product [Linum tenue]CAI0469473.1 unnamed protein product [Linum tenue]